MLWYVVFISVLNLGLGYALALYLGAPGRRVRSDVADLSTWLGSAGATTMPDVEKATASAVTRLPRSAAAASAAGAPSTFAADGATDNEQQPAGATDVRQIAADRQDQPAAAPPAAAAQPSAAPSPTLDPDTELVTREYVDQMLDELKTAGAGRGRMSAALVEIHWTGQVNQDTKVRLLHGVADTVRQLFGHRDTAARYSDQQFLLLMPDDNVEQAGQRVEQLRQRVEATKYVANGVDWPTTLTCALTEVGRDADRAKLLENLDEALAEAQRYGGNRTFMHDGISPTPVVPLELHLAADKCTV